MNVHAAEEREEKGEEEKEKKKEAGEGGRAPCCPLPREASKTDASFILPAAGEKGAARKGEKDQWGEEQRHGQQGVGQGQRLTALNF